MGELMETKSRFALVGKIKGISKDKAHRNGTSEKNGADWRSIRFGVQTSQVNVIYVELMGMERDTVNAWDAKNKKSKKFDFGDRHNLPSGFTILEARVGTEKGKSHGMAAFDAVEEINDNFDDNDSVKVSGKIEYGTYENKDGETVIQRRFVIQSIERVDEIDFETKDFKPTNEFMQEFVVIGTDYDKDLNKLFINAYTIPYGGKKFTASTFTIDGAENKKFLDNVKKALKPGDLVKTTGIVLNAVELEEVEEEETDADIFGGKTSTAFNKKQAIKSITKELRIEGIPEYEPKRYDIDEDFVVDEAEVNFEGTKSKKSSPFSGNGKKAEVEEEDDDDVPF